MTRAEWRAWLEANHGGSTGVWLIQFKKAAGGPHVSYEEQVEEALCFGWVDSRPAKLDEARTMLYYSPRKAGSAWARPNKERVARLLSQGLMREAGLAKVDAAKQDGSWTKLDEVEDLIAPPDLVDALAALPPAAENWGAFPRSAKRGILEWIVQAKTEATRAKRIAQTAELAQQNARANQWQPKGNPPKDPADDQKSG